MATDAPAALMTTGQLLELPENDDVTRELIEGELWERRMTTRSPKHSTAIIRIGYLLCQWCEQSGQTGVVAGGEARCRLTRDPDTTVGLDVAYFDESVAAALADDDRFFDGPPIIAVEVLSPSDNHEALTRKIRQYLAADVPQVWIVDPDFRTVAVHRPGEEPVSFNASQELTGEPELPGFRVAVASLFLGK